MLVLSSMGTKAESLLVNMPFGLAGFRQDPEDKANLWKSTKAAPRAKSKEAAEITVHTAVCER